MSRLAATLPGYASVARASELLHLAPRSVRDLIYAGRIPSLRVGRQHFIRSADLEVERRRRRGLPLPRRRQPSATHARRQSPRRRTEPRNPSLDDALRRQRASERTEMVTRWAQRHGFLHPHVPAHVREVTTPVDCESCGRTLRHGRYVEVQPDDGQPATAQLCVTCGRRALLEWADRRRLEAATARQLSRSLGEPEQPPAHQLELSVDPPVDAAVERTTELLGALAETAQPAPKADDPRAA